MRDNSTESGDKQTSRSLIGRVAVLEKRLIARRHRVRSLATGIKRKFNARLVSPAVLLTAAGIGVAIEQTTHHRRWSLGTVLETAYASIRLLMAVSSPTPPINGHSNKNSDNESADQSI